MFFIPQLAPLSLSSVLAVALFPTVFVCVCLTLIATERGAKYNNLFSPTFYACFIDSIPPLQAAHLLLWVKWTYPHPHPPSPSSSYSPLASRAAHKSNKSVFGQSSNWLSCLPSARPLSSSLPLSLSLWPGVEQLKFFKSLLQLWTLQENSQHKARDKEPSRNRGKVNLNKTW